MRVISGIRRGLKLKPPEGENTRPTTDRVKEAVFNIIQTHIPANRVLDLFAGSGALGIEALSRRSEHCVFVERSRTAYELVKYNLELSKLLESAELVLSDALAYLGTAKEPFDIIFLDPPYNKGMLEPVLDEIGSRGLLERGGVIVAETEKNGEEALHPGFDTLRRSVYGKTVITVLGRGDNS